jgi:dipeptidyl aminopeptidase/acylaminoacyl peptidase
VARFDVVDPDRLGVLGGSYGGYLTAWIVGHDHRFRAACAERSVTNLLTHPPSADIGWWFTPAFLDADLLGSPDALWRLSPVAHAADIRTPLLLVHSEGDLRCPINQAEDLFLRLKLLGREVELVRFTGESHELSRSGSPRHRVERMEVILEWFGRHLGGEAPDQPCAGS